MTETLLMIVAGIVFIIGPFVLLASLDKRKAKKGALFTGKRTKGMQALAIFLAVLFGCIFLYQFFFTHEFNLIFPILTVALIAYGFGGETLLNRFQNRQPSAQNQPQTQQSAIGSSNSDETRLISQRSSRFLLRIAIILVLSGIFLLGAWWAATHQDNPLAIVFVVGTILLVVVAKILDWVGFFKKWFK